MDLYDDVLFLPPPDFGQGPKIGGGSWQWAVTSAADATGANSWMETALADEYVADYANQTGLIPATDAAAELTENYATDGALRMMVDYSKAYAVLRPETPAYTVIASVFGQYTGDIIHGGDVQESLDAMVVRDRRRHRLELRVRVLAMAVASAERTMPMVPLIGRGRAAAAASRGPSSAPGAAFAIPGVALLLLFVIGPAVVSLVLAFTNARLISPTPPEFVGLENFQRAFTDDATFQRSMLNTFLFACIVVPLQGGLGLVLALLVNQKLGGTELLPHRLLPARDHLDGGRRACCGASCTRRTG